MFDLTFLINKEKAIQVKNMVMDELDSWNGMLAEADEDTYYKLIQALEDLIASLK